MTADVDERKQALEVSKLELEVRRLDQQLAIGNLEHQGYEDSRRNRDADAGTVVDERSVATALASLDHWSRRDPGQPITVVFNSPGGTVLDGLALFDYLVELRAAGHEVTTVALGKAASMGGVLLQAGTRRVMSRNAFVLVHEVSSATFGTVTEMGELLDFSARLADRCAELLAERSTLTKAPGEVLADDFRILAARVETEFWPHPGVPHPRSQRGLQRWWHHQLAALREAC